MRLWAMIILRLTHLHLILVYHLVLHHLMILHMSSVDVESRLMGTVKKSKRHLSSVVLVTIGLIGPAKHTEQPMVSRTSCVQSVEYNHH